MAETSTVRIGCSSAFWGDSPAAAHQLVHHGNIRYLVADYLAEVTMGILAKRRDTSGKALGGAGRGGFIAEFVNFVWRPLMLAIMRQNIRVVTNAGGMDPRALKIAIEEAAQEAGLDVMPVVAAVYGDDLLPEMSPLLASGSIKPFSHIEGSDDTETIPSDRKIESLNAYVGAEGIRRALDSGAQIVVTGRCVDSALVLGPLMHEFGWSPTDWNLLAAGSLAGHIIECGCQATGGNFTDWDMSAFSANGGWSNMGYPIVECAADGSFVVTKAPETGGVVSVLSVAEQMLYEIGDPAAYILPDVIVDLTNVTLRSAGKDRVLVAGARGRASTPYLKVSGIYMDGYKVTGEIFIGGIDAMLKAKIVGESIIARVRGLFTTYGIDDFRDVSIEMLGAEFTYGPHTRAAHTREVVLRLTVHHDNPQALKIFLMEIAPASPLGGRDLKATWFISPVLSTSKSNTAGPVMTRMSKSYPHFVPASYRSLIEFCVGRSGDKGDSANIGVIAREQKYYEWIRAVLTEETVHRYFRHLMGKGGQVKRFELPGCNGLNFLLTKCLGGGGLSSLKIDRQGKTYAQMLLSMRIPVPSWFDMVPPKL